MKRKFTFVAATLTLLAILIAPLGMKGQTTVTYTISKKNTLTTTGTAPTGSSASIVETYSTSCQMTSGKSQTLTLSGYNGYRVTQITMSMHSNKSSGGGKLSYSTDGGTSYTYIIGSSSSGSNFNSTNWYGSWSESYVNVNKTVNITPSSSNFIIKIEATSNSLYCQSYTLTYETYTPSYTINAQSNDPSLGTVSCTGSTITASPASGCRVSTSNPYTVSPAGSATVTQNGNTFTVNPSANTTVTINFETTPTHTITFSVNEEEVLSQTLPEGAAITVPTPPAEINGKTFVGWVETAIPSTQPSAPSLVTPTVMGTTNKTYYACYASVTPGTSTDPIDVLNRETTGVTSGSTSYTDWNTAALTSNSGAVYAGRSAGTNNSIQLRSKNEDSGVVTTTSGGRAKKVTIVWESHTPSDRSLDIYGKSSAYSAATQLYDNSTSGTLLGNVLYGTTELTITGDYEYIGMRSHSDAIYITSISIQWENGTPDTYSDYTTVPEPCHAPTNLSVSNIAATSASISWSGQAESYNLRYRVQPQGGSTMTYDFEDGTSQGWTWFDNDGDEKSWIVSNALSSNNNIQSHGGDYYARSTYNANANADNWLISPQFRLGGSISFFITRLYNSDYDDYYSVYISTSGTDISDFTEITSGAIEPNYDDYQEVSFDLSSYNGLGYIAIRHTANDLDQAYLFVDDITIVEGIETIAWSTPVPANTENTSYLLTGLMPETTYEVQVQSVCEENTTSSWSTVVSFTTESSVTITKTITGYSTGNDKWYLITSPLKGEMNGKTDPTTVTNMITSNASDYDLYYFDADGDDDGNEWINYKAVNGFNLEAGKGYLYANKGDANNNPNTVTLIFTGAPYSGEGKVDLTNTGRGSFAGWNLVGNPFTVRAYVDRAYYVMNENGDGFIAAEPENNYVNPMEGIFVYTATSTTMTFSTTAPGTDGNNAILALNLSQGQGVMDRAIVRFDNSNPLPKLQLWGNTSQVYIPVDGKDYAVVNAQGQGELPVSFKAKENGTYTLSTNTKDVSFGYLHLIDNLTGNDVDLLATPSYSFEAKTSDYANRFKLVFATASGNADGDNDFAFFSNGSLVVNNPSTGSGAATLQVIDVNGRILKSESINGCANVNLNAAPGVYMIRLVNGNNVKTQKIVVR